MANCECHHQMVMLMIPQLQNRQNSQEKLDLHPRISQEKLLSNFAACKQLPFHSCWEPELWQW